MACEPIHFAPGTSANVLRGALGTIFRRLACHPQCTHARVCPERRHCPYARLFEPAAVTAGPSGLADWPRPFVLRATHLDGQTFAAGEAFHFDLHLFEANPATVALLARTFAELAHEGLGPARRKVELRTVARMDERGEPCAVIYPSGSLQAVPQAPALTLALNLEKTAQPVARILVRFVTPFEVKSVQVTTDVCPAFAVLAARARDRISTLRALYGEGPLPIDFRAFGERAAQVKMTPGCFQHCAIHRRSSRTGQLHPIGGFVGEAEYEGDLAEFLPYLSAAKWTGIGRQTVWGKGEIATRILS